MNKKKLVLSISFYLVGTVLIGYLGVVMTGNFFSDSRVFAKTNENTELVATASVTPGAEEKSQKPTFGAQSDGVFKYKRAADVYVKANTPSPAREDGLDDPDKKNLTPTISGAKELSPTNAKDSAKGKTSGTPSPKNDKINGTPSPKKEDANNITSPEGSSETPNKSKTVVEIINKSGDKNLANDVRKTLEAQGFEVSSSNADSVVSVKTQIIDRKGGDAAANIRRFLKSGYITKNLDPSSRVDVTIIIGDDYK